MGVAIIASSMRIAFFHNLPTGGAKRVVYEQIKYLSERHEVDLYVINSKEQQLFDPEQFVKNTYRYDFSLQSKNLGFFNRFMRDYKNFFVLKQLQKRIAEKIDSKKYTVVIVHPDKYIQTPFILKFLKTKTVYFCEEWLRIVYEPEFAFHEKVSVFKKFYEILTRAIRKRIDYSNMRSSKLILANSVFTAGNIKKAYRRDAVVTLLGVDTKFYQSKRSRKNCDVLFVGEKVPQEGYQLLREAEKYCVSKPNIRVLSRKNDKLVLTDEDMVKEYNEAKLVVALSSKEPFGLIPLEAMACGVPVIVVDEGGYKETVKDGKTGFLVARNAKLLAEKVDLLLGDAGMRKKMGERAREDMVKRWSWERHGEKIEKEIFK